jgi:glycosyltransferase involved in cell wall biosynthesis
VVAYARGGLREVVADGVTGWLVPPDDQDAAVTALGNIAALDRAACRLWVSERFSLDTMLDAYELFYQGMLD